MLSLGVTSPFVPLSKNCWLAEPPMAVRLALTAKPVLVGPVPGVTVTVSRVVPPARTELGLAAHVPRGLPQPFNEDAVFRGLGATAVKSAELLSVSVQPAPALSAAVVLDSVGVGPTPSKQLVPTPKPTKSTTVAPVGQAMVPIVV